jgi:5-methylcytosine-specific restriction protein B
MAFPTNITKDDLLKAIDKIEEEGYDHHAESLYYDVVFNGKTYPPKLVVSYANFFANGEILDRNSFDGGIGTPCFKLLEKNGFNIQEKSSPGKNERNVWFVTQGSTFSPDRGMKFLFAPSLGNDGKKRFYWENLLEVKKGDIIFNYSEGLKGVSLATKDGYPAHDEDPNSKWASDGYKVDIDITLLSPIITREELAQKKQAFSKLLVSVKNKPFNNVGGINQGYLYHFSKEAGKLIRDLYGKKFGNETIDNFFDQVDSKEGLLKNNKMFSYKSFFLKTHTANFFINENLALRFIASLLTKPFVILTGLSGSGKSKLAQAFAMWICESEDQYCLLPVGADWTNREPLLGFPNALDAGKYVKPDNKVLDLIIDASKNNDKPYFLILDEMNLSHVERYFADFLSAMESHQNIFLHAGNEPWSAVPHQFTLPENLFIIGTVNIDETTYMFSPKVLDRANVIEFRVTADEMETFLSNNRPLNLDSLKFVGASTASSFLEIASDKRLVPKNIKELNAALITFFDELKKTGAEFGFRTAAEILRFTAIINHIEPEWTITGIIDAAIMQKLLPKVHGSRRKLEPVLKTLGKLCLKDDKSLEDYLSGKKEFDSKDDGIIYPLALEKIVRMNLSLINNGFTSYAEA